MRLRILLLLFPAILMAQQAADTALPTTPSETIKTLVGRLDLQRYKTTIRGLTKFGDRREGTDRNRQAIDWTEAQLKSYGCTNTERIRYEYHPAARGACGGAGGTGGAPGGAQAAVGVVSRVAP